MRVPGRTGMQAWLYGGHRRPTPSGHFPARGCTPWPIVAGFHFGNPRAMRLRRTLHRSRGDHPVLAWAVRYALATVVVGAGILLIGPSPAVGWALVVFGGSLATLASGLFTRRGAEADSGTAGSALGASRRDRPDRRIPRAAVNGAPAQPAGARAVRARPRDGDTPFRRRRNSGLGGQFPLDRLGGAGASRRRSSTAGNDLWKGNTLEWFTPTPPPPNKFDVIPRVRSVEPMKDIRHDVAAATSSTETVAQPAAPGASDGS